RRCAGRGPGNDSAVAEPLEDRSSERGPADRRAEPKLVPAGQEDPGRLVDRADRGFVARLGAGDRMDRSDPLHAELTEDRPVPLPRLRPERAGGADDGDGRVGTTGERDETA